MTTELRGISSMATRLLLGELVPAWQAHAGGRADIESTGGVDAARRVQAGEAFDVAILASDAIDRLIASGHVVPDGRIDLVRSPVALAVRAGAPHPDIGSEAAVRRAVLAARSIGYSTGPSGTWLTRLFERWGIADDVRGRIVQARPGVPVGASVASGEVELGFQQLSELLPLPGIDVLGTLPDDIAFITVFSGGVCAGGARQDTARAMLAFMASPAVAPIKRRHGMEPA